MCVLGEGGEGEDMHLCEMHIPNLFASILTQGILSITPPSAGDADRNGNLRTHKILDLLRLQSYSWPITSVKKGKGKGSLC